MTWCLSPAELLLLSTVPCCRALGTGFFSFCPIGSLVVESLPQPGAAFNEWQPSVIPSD